MAAVEVAEEALDGALMFACGFVVLTLKFGVADVELAVFAVIFGGGFPVFGHVYGQDGDGCGFGV